MSAPSTTPVRSAVTRRPLAFTLLAFYSVLLCVITFIPQLYYVLFALNPDAFPIGADANPLGAVWYNYILGGHQGGYLAVDAGVLAGALEDVFLLGPLYLATGIGLLRPRPWSRNVALITGAMGLYSILYFVLSGTIGQHDPTDTLTTILSAVPYFAYDVLVLAAVLTHQALFVRPSDRA